MLAAALAAVLVLTPLAGSSRVDAADPGLDVVYVATGFNFPDALVGGAIAAMTGGPILTVRGPNEGDAIPQVTAAELQRLRPKKIVILGGRAVVSDKVEGELAAFTDPPGNVERLAGLDRFETAVEISRALPSKIANVLHADSATTADSALTAASATTADSAADADRLGGVEPEDFWQKSEAVDADTLAGLGADDFWQRDDAVDAATLGGVTAETLGSVHGSRQRELFRTAASEDGVVARSVDFEAPADGFALIMGKSFLANEDTSPRGALVFLTVDWDGAAETLFDRTAELGQLDMEATGEVPSTGTITLVSAVPIGAGPHTVDLVVIADPEVKFNVPSLNVLFTPFGAADDLGIEP